MKDINAVRVFVQVAKARSFSEAGRRLGLTSSAVSKAIRRLEQEFGVRLFNRTTRSVGLTHDGQGFFERCCQILGDLEEAENQLTQAAVRPRGRLRLHMPNAFGRFVVLPALTRALETAPDLQVDIELGERVVDPAEEGLDAVIRFGDLPNSGLVARKLCDIRFIFCASPSYLDRHGVPATPADLAQHTCLGYVTPWTGHYREWRFSVEGAHVRQDVYGRMNINSAETLLDIAVAGAGITHIADFVALDAVRAGVLRLVLQQYVAAPVPVSLLYLHVRKRSPRLRWFVEAMRAGIPSPAPWEKLTGG